MDGPRHDPSLTAIGRLFPTPIECVADDVFVNHALFNVLPLWVLGMPRKDHLAISEFAYEIQIPSLIVDPGLLPLLQCRVVHGDADAMQPSCGAAVELLLNDAIVEHFANGVAAMLHLVRLGTGP